MTISVDKKNQSLDKKEQFINQLNACLVTLTESATSFGIVGIFNFNYCF